MGSFLNTAKIHAGWIFKRSNDYEKLKAATFIKRKIVLFLHFLFGKTCAMTFLSQHLPTRYSKKLDNYENH